MHDYSIDNHPKEKIIFFLSFLAIAGTPLLNSWVSGLLNAANRATGWALPIVALPVIGLFLAMYWCFNTKLWKWGRLRRLLLVPDLNGTWICQGKMVMKNGEAANFEWEGELRITQSWSKILIDLRTPKSGSKSVSASVVRVPGAGYRVLYQYQNDPLPGDDGLLKHDGAAELEFDESCTTGSGHYFTDQHRNTVGIMKIRRV